MTKSTATSFSSWVFLGALYAPTILLFYFAVSRPYIATSTFSEARIIILVLFAPIVVKYIIQLFIAPWYSFVEAKRARAYPLRRRPAVSVLIPAWNEEVGIISTISSVLRTKYPYLEIIIINDGSTDKTDNVVRAFISRYEQSKKKSAPKIVYKQIPNSGKARALNIALELATSEIVVTIDADSAMEKQAIENFVKHFADRRVASVAGNVAIGNRTSALGLIQQLEYLYGFYFKRADSILNAVYIVGGAAAAYRKKIIVALGGFDEEIITEDIELSMRIQAHGYRVRYAADAIVYTEGPSDVSGLCKQRLRWKYGRLLAFWKYRRLFFSLSQQHNFFLSFLILPLALFAECLLLFEGFFLAVFYAYTFYTNDFVPLIFVILFLIIVIWLQILSDPKIRYHRNLFVLAPGAWIIFYVFDAIEFQALFRSILSLVTKREVVWQRWTRAGVFGSNSH